MAKIGYIGAVKKAKQKSEGAMEMVPSDYFMLIPKMLVDKDDEQK